MTIFSKKNCFFRYKHHRNFIADNKIMVNCNLIFYKLNIMKNIFTLVTLNDFYKRTNMVVAPSPNDKTLKYCLVVIINNNVQ